MSNTKDTFLMKVIAISLILIVVMAGVGLIHFIGTTSNSSQEQSAQEQSVQEKIPSLNQSEFSAEITYFIQTATSHFNEADRHVNAGGDRRLRELGQEMVDLAHDNYILIESHDTSELSRQQVQDFLSATEEYERVGVMFKRERHEDIPAQLERFFQAVLKLE